MGTYGAALEARQVNASDGKLAGETVGEVEAGEDKVLIIKRIHVRLLLTAPESARETAERVHDIYAEKCPVYRSLKDAIDITTELVFQPE